MIKSSPTSKLIAPKVNKRLPVFINENQMEGLLQETDLGGGFAAMRDRLIFELLYGTGMRCSELVNLNDNSVDSYSQSLKVLGKGNKERIIPLSKPMMKLIKDYKQMRNKKFGAELFIFVDCH